MNDEFRHLVIETLRRGEDLPREWARELFPPEKREYELVYTGKEREEDILAGTMAVPLQTVRTFGEAAASDNDWHNMLIFGDNLQALRRLVEMKQSGELCNADGTSGVRMVYIDPPFATKQEFRGSQEQKAYQDKIAGAEFLEYLRKRLILLRDLLSNDGSIYVHLDTRKVHYAKILMDEVFGEHNFTSEIIWKRTSAHSDSKTYASVHDTLLFYSRSTETRFLPQYMDYSDEHIQKRYRHIDENGRRFTDGDLVGKGLRGGGYTYEWKGITKNWRCPIETMQKYEEEGRLYYTRKGVARIKRYLDELPGKAPADLWTSVYPVNSQAVERLGYPTQKPEALLNLIIASSSNPGDIVLDAFAGSGTTCAVAEKLGRRWIGIDAGKLAVYTIQKRLLNLRDQIGNRGEPLAPKPFTFYNAGLYDFETLRTMSWDGWRFFALQLFECKDEPHIVGGLRFDGKRQGSSTLVFNFHKTPEARVDDTTILEIHRAVGRQVGRRVFIIAPRNLFDFQQDYLTFDGVCYYALRIPYSFIGELHRREFAALHQPRDENAVNEVMDAVGFDFIRPPHVVWEAGTATRIGQLLLEAYLDLREFESRAYIRGQDTCGGLETFSMLLLDFDYDSQADQPVFNFSAVFFAHQLATTDWRAWFPVEGLGEHIMAVFVDIYGNEARELIPRAQFEETSPGEVDHAPKH